MGNKRKLLGFAGRKRCGKTMLANMFKQEEDAVIITIANYLKYLCCDLLNMSYDELIEKKDNGYTFSYVTDDRWVNLIHKRTGISKENILTEIGDFEFTTIRQMLQVIGTDLIRKYDPDWHIRQMEEAIKSYSEDRLIVVDDVRFPNEVETIKKLGGDVYFIVRTYCKEVSNHISETSLSWYDFDNDHVLINQLNEDHFMTYVMFHYKHDFKNEYNCGVLLSENLHLLEQGRYGIEEPDNKEFFNDLICQIKNYPSFLNYGFIKYKTCIKDYADEFVKNINKRYTNLNSRCNEFITMNPLITENLKKYL